MIPFVDLTAGYGNDWGDLLRAQRQPVEAGRFLGGEEVAAFERDFGRLCGAPVAAVACGTNALTIALRAVGLQPGDTVVVPAFGCPATVVAVANAGLRCWPVDVEPTTGLLPPAAAAQAAGACGAGAIVPVHLYGRAVDVVALRAAVGDRIRIVEDACQAVLVPGVGRHGDAAAWSFYPTKNLGAWGDGGAVSAPRDGTVAEVKILRNYGRLFDASWSIPQPGWCSRLDEQQAAVLRAKLPLLARWQRQRAKVAEAYYRLLPTSVRCGVGPAVTANYHLFPVLVPDPAMLAVALAQRGIGTGRHYPAVQGNDALGWLGYRPYQDRFPVAAWWANHELSLPLYPGLGEDAVATVCAALRDLLGDGPPIAWPEAKP